MSLVSTRSTSIWLKALCLLGLISLTACSSLPDQKSLERRAQSQSTQAISGSRLMQRSKLSLQKANTEQLAFYAPSYFQGAKEHYQKALDIYKQKGDKQDLKMNAHLSMEFVNGGMRNKKLVKEHLSRSLKHKRILSDLDAKQHQPELAAKIEEQHLNVIRLIEMQQLDDLKQAEKALLKDMHQLEIKVIDATYLGQAILMLEQAKAINALEIMPKTLQKAENSLKDAQQYIRQNPRDILKIEDYADDALFNCERLYSLTRFARQLQVAEVNQLESLVLKQEEHLTQIRQGLVAQDSSNLSMQDQSILLSQAAQALIAENERILKQKGKAAHKDLEKWRRKVVLLQAEVRRLKKIIKDKSRY